MTSKRKHMMKARLQWCELHKKSYIIDCEDCIREKKALEPQIKYDDNGDAWISEDGGKTWRKADMGYFDD